MATASWPHGASAMRLTEGLVSALKEPGPEHLPALLSGYRDHGLLQTQGDVGGLVGFSNSKLGSSKTRFEGLCLLSVLVKDSSSELFEQNCLSWLRSLQQVIQSRAPVQTLQLSMSILKDLLQFSAQLAEVAREVSLNSILGILTSLLGLKTEFEMAAMDGMISCMKFYPRACGSLRDKLGAYFLSKMDSKDKKTQEKACLCYGLLPSLGGLLDRGIGAARAEAWTNQIHCLLATANNLLALIYPGSDTEGTVQYKGPGVDLRFPPVDQTDSLLLLQLQHRFTAVCLALKHTLSVDPASAVRLPVRPILNLLCRALAVGPKSISLTGDGSLRLLGLPVVHTSSLKVLTALLTLARGGMMEYSVVLQRLLSQTLSAWTPTPETSAGQQRAYSSVRVSVYTTLELWVQVSGASAGVLQTSPGQTELLFSHLLCDIMPGPHSVKIRAGLAADVVQGGKPGPRRTKPLVMADAGGPLLHRKGDHLANQDTCVSALRALRQIILTSGSLLKDDIHKRLHDVLLPLCVRLQQQQSSSAVCEPAGGVGGQYSSALTRYELYRLLMALVLVPAPCWPPPLSCAVSIFSSGRTDRNLQISTFCTESLSICNSLLHPRTTSLSLPLPPLSLKPPPTAAVVPSSSQGSGPTPGLSLPTLLGGPAPPGSPFPVRHSLTLGTTSLMGSLENHLSLVPDLSAQHPPPVDMILSPHAQHLEQGGLGPPEGQRPVFVRYEKEEAEDVEISLASDSDDSVVIVPPGMLLEPPPQDDPPPPTSAAPPGGVGLVLPEGEGSTVVTTAATATTMDGVSLSNNLSSSSPLLTTAAPPLNAFAAPSTSVVSMVPPPLNTSTSAPGCVGSLMPGRPLQQMLLQGSAGGPPPMAMPLQMPNQLSQPGRHLHPHPPPPPPVANQDSAVININSTDEEEEEEDDEEELDEEDEEEDVSNFAEEEEEFYDGEDYEYDEEEAEELEEEEEEEEDEEDGEILPQEEGEVVQGRRPIREEGGDIPPLEGAEEQAEEDLEEGEELQAPAEEEEEEGMSGYSLTGDEGKGIQEIQTSREMFGEDRTKVQQVESIGVLEETQVEEEEEEEEVEDPTMPQILCVTGGAMEEREELEDKMEAADGEGGGGEQGCTPPTEESNWNQKDDSVAESKANGGAAEAEVAEAQSADSAAAEHQSSASAASASAAGHSPTDEEEKDEEREEEETEQLQSEGGEREGDEGKGVKRKREEPEEENSLGKQKLSEETMASMLADFVACPPDSEDGASGQT